MHLWYHCCFGKKAFKCHENNFFKCLVICYFTSLICYLTGNSFLYVLDEGMVDLQAFKISFVFNLIKSWHGCDSCISTEGMCCAKQRHYCSWAFYTLWLTESCVNWLHCEFLKIFFRLWKLTFSPKVDEILQKLAN